MCELDRWLDDGGPTPEEEEIMTEHEAKATAEEVEARKLAIVDAVVDDMMAEFQALARSMRAVWLELHPGEESDES